MLRAVLFDLDETLLNLDLNTFLEGYFADLSSMVIELSDLPSARCNSAIMHASHTMLSSRDDELSNKQIFDKVVFERTGLDLMSGAVVERFTAYHEKGLDHLRSDYGPNEGAHEAVSAAKELGLKVILATNPTFPLPIGIERLRWAGFSPTDFEFITSYETSTRTKPYARYYEETLARAGVEADEALMVGNDPRNDIPQPDVGLEVFLVEDVDHERMPYKGSLLQLPALLEKLTR